MKKRSNFRKGGRTVAKKKKRLWLRLDNAAKIFPASMRRGWSNVFRVSVSLKEKVDPKVLEKALARIAPRFPSVCAHLGKGLFWYYLEEGDSLPPILEEASRPLLPMQKKEMSRSALRVIYYENRIAVEFFHALTDGSGAMVFLKTLAAAYLEEAHSIFLPKESGVLDPEGEVLSEELEDAFLRYEGKVCAKRETDPAFALTGIPEPDGFLHVTCAGIPVKEALAISKEKKVSLTTLLSAVLVLSLKNIQKRKVAPIREKAVRVQIPVNLRKMFPSATLRNFVAVVNGGLEKGETDAELDEILSRIHHQMALFTEPRHLRAVFSANVKSEKGILIRFVPRFIKDIVMRAVFDRVGESLACLCLSNLGEVQIPEAMKEYVSRFDFIIGPQAKAPYNCGVISYGGTLYINLVRNTKIPELEREFFSNLSSLGMSFELESNER